MTAYLEWFEDYFVMHYEDIVTIDETAVLYSDILAKDNFYDMKFGIVDTTKLIEANYDNYDYERHAALTVVAERSRGIRNLKIGVVVINPKVAEYVKLLKEKTASHQHSWHRKLFSSMEEALTWCKKT